MIGIATFAAQAIRLLLLALGHPVVQAGINEGLRAAAREVVRRSTSVRSSTKGERVDINRA